MVARKPAYNGDSEAHEFHFHSLGALHDPLQPQIDVRLDSGVKSNKTARTKPSVTDEEAVALWDKLIDTIRVRQTVGVKQRLRIAGRLRLAFEHQGTRGAEGDAAFRVVGHRAVVGIARILPIHHRRHSKERFLHLVGAYHAVVKPVGDMLA